ncbi:WAT1-related protein At1g68170 [Spinacia oleracea]|uniref:WAT1-related protein n=1 Tax=Spinacia oleracea TaxID=3562 RepID=A0A9R0J7G1_SPIOL|nr:WAT1-related protein At1g68170-like [Spinacia oleracea]
MSKPACKEKLRNLFNLLKPVSVMLLVQVGIAGADILSKLALYDGMNSQVMVAYRFLFAAGFTIPFALFMDRNISPKPKLTWTVIGQAFLCGLLGGSLLLTLLMESLVLTTVTFVAAMSNLLPPITFILAVCFRLESVSLKKLPAIAKVLGSLLGMAGAMLMTFYKGVQIKLWTTNIHLPNVPSGASSHKHDGLNLVWGTLLALGSCLSFAAWLIVQVKLSNNYPSPYATTALMSLMGCVQAVVFALCVEHDWQEWKLGWDIRLLAVAFSGIFGSGVLVALTTWCNNVKGPLFVSIFSPVTLVVAALVGSLMLNDKLYLGSVLGAIVIVLGLYAVIWGKSKEEDPKTGDRVVSTE